MIKLIGRQIENIITVDQFKVNYSSNNIMSRSRRGLVGLRSLMRERHNLEMTTMRLGNGYEDQDVPLLLIPSSQIRKYPCHFMSGSVTTVLLSSFTIHMEK